MPSSSSINSYVFILTTLSLAKTIYLTKSDSVEYTATINRLMHWLEITAQVSQIAGVISVIFAAVSIRSNTHLSKRQWNVDTFNLYFERHQNAIESFPDNAFYERFDPDKLPPRSAALTAAVRRYLFVIQAVDYLAYQNYIDDSIWNVWREDMKKTLSCPVIYREWPDIKQDFEVFEAFTQFVESTFHAAKAQTPTGQISTE